MGEKIKMLICRASDCNSTFFPRLGGKPREYCSDRCRDREKQRRYRIERPKEGRCPQCNHDWVEPKETHRGKPEHCLHCQEYYNERYENSKQ